MRYRPKTRPAQWKLNPRSPLAQGLVFAGLGQYVGGLHYNDASLYGNHGTLTGYTGAGNQPSNRWSVDGTLGRPRLGFTGASYVLGPTLQLTELTIALWINRTGVTSRIMCHTSSSGNYPVWSFEFLSDTPYFGSANSDGSSLLVEPSTVTFAGLGWHHAAVAHVAATSKNKFYIDGQQLGGIANSSRGALSLSTGVLNLGRWFYNGTWYYLAESLADVMIWNRSLAAPEIRATADRSNVLLECGSQPLCLPLRTLWPAGAVPSASPAVNYRRRKILLCGAD